jgi:ribosome-binding factor A
MSDEIKEGKVKSIISIAAAEFIERESNGRSLITVTDIRLFNRGKSATILVSVLPETATEGALEFLKRQRGEFREYIKKHTRLMMLPFFDFDIDKGELNRQRIDALTSENHEPLPPITALKGSLDAE